MVLRRHIPKTRASSWVRRGFLPEEAYYLSEISSAGANAPYIRAMRRRRSSLNANRVKYGWDMAQYRRRVVADYQRVGIRGRSRDRLGRFESYADYFRKVFYDYFTVFKDTTPLIPEWKTPRRKKRIRVKGETKPQANKRRMLRIKIDDFNQRINRASARGDQILRRQLEHERNSYQIQLDSLE